MVLMVLLVSTVSTMASREDITVYRIHYGIVFRSEGELSMYNSVWRHTTKIQLPKKIKWEPIMNCKDKLSGEKVKLFQTLTYSPDVEITREINAIRRVIIEE